MIRKSTFTCKYQSAVIWNSSNTLTAPILSIASHNLQLHVIILRSDIAVRGLSCKWWNCFRLLQITYLFAHEFASCASSAGTTTPTIGSSMPTIDHIACYAMQLIFDKASKLIYQKTFKYLWCAMRLAYSTFALIVCYAVFIGTNIPSLGSEWQIAFGKYLKFCKIVCANDDALNLHCRIIGSFSQSEMAVIPTMSSASFT